MKYILYFNVADMTSAEAKKAATSEVTNLKKNFLEPGDKIAVIQVTDQPTRLEPFWTPEDDRAQGILNG